MTALQPRRSVTAMNQRSPCRPNCCLSNAQNPPGDDGDCMTTLQARQRTDKRVLMPADRIANTKVEQDIVESKPLPISACSRVLQISHRETSFIMNTAKGWVFLHSASML